MHLNRRERLLLFRFNYRFFRQLEGADQRTQLNLFRATGGESVSEEEEKKEREKREKQERGDKALKIHE
jgi:hypothetical protein